MNRARIILIGFLTGLVDAVPGVSGSTMLLVFGAYEQTVSYGSDILYHQIPSLLSDLLSSQLGTSDLEFAKVAYLLVILMGIAIGLVSSFLVFDRLLHIIPSSVYGLFTGLILVSSYIVANRNEKIRKPGNIKWIILGILVSAFVVLVSFETGESKRILFISGFAASFGMLLPGISGSFLLLVIGKYSFITDLFSSIIKSPNLLLSSTGVQLATLGLGGVLGVAVNLRTVPHLIEANRKATLSVMLGLMIGGLLAPLNEFLGLSDQDPVLFIASFLTSLIGGIIINHIQFN